MKYTLASRFYYAYTVLTAGFCERGLIAQSADGSVVGVQRWGVGASSRGAITHVKNLPLMQQMYNAVAPIARA